MPTPNPTQQKIIDIAAKYGYRLTTCYAERYEKGGKIYHYLGFYPNERISPNIYFDEGTYRSKVTGLDRFKINHSALGSLSIQDEEEFITKVQDAIQMCKELNEINLDDIPVEEDFEDSVDLTRRSQVIKTSKIRESIIEVFNVKSMRVEKGDEHKEGYYDGRKEYFGYALVSNVPCGKFYVPFVITHYGKYIPVLPEESPWNFFKGKDAWSESQYEFFRTHKVAIKNRLN